MDFQLKEVLAGYQDAKDVRSFRVYCEPGHVYYVVGQDGKLERVEALDAPRCDAFLDIDSFLKALGTFTTAGTDVYIDQDKVVAVLFNRDEEMGRRDRLEYRLIRSSAYEFLGSCPVPKLSQLDLLRAFKVSLCGCLELEQAIEKYGSIRFRMSEGGTNTVKSGKQTVDLAIERELAGIDADLPEEFTVMVPVFENVRLQSGPDTDALIYEPVKLRVDIDLVERRFTLMAMPGELFRAMDAALREIKDHIEFKMTEDQSLNVFLGTPNG